jgi:glycosyltransferase involved in cell wall biosynthesis
MKERTMSIPLISVVIPTRNRFQYVKSAITSILDINDSRIELIIQDNSDSNVLMMWINDNIIDVRLKYNYSDSPLSFVGNFSEGVEASTGEYICIIGDDDGINPEIIDAVAWLKQENIDCLSTRISANFVWGDAEVPTTLFTNVTGGVLSISKLSGIIIEAKPEEELLAFVNGGLISYLDFNLPKIYHGIVKTECLREIKQKTGSYFGGLSPDIFASICLACIVKRIFVTDYPLTISGVCGVSASIVEGLLKKNSKKLEDAPHLRNRGHYEWSELVPRVYCVETIWADSAIAALKSMERNDLLEHIDIPRFSAACINANKGITKQVIASMKDVSKFRGDNYFKYYFLFSWRLFVLKSNYISHFFNRIRNRASIIIGKKQFQSINGLNNINEATVALTKYLSDKSILFKGFTN